HPYQPEETVQGALQVMYELQEMLKQIAGMDDITLQPAAGAQGEYTGIQLIRAYHLSRGDTGRDIILVPDSAHGTNPATAAAAGFNLISLKSGPDGRVALDALRSPLAAGGAGLV